MYKTKVGVTNFSLWCTQCNTERAKAYRATPKGKENIYKAVYKSIAKYPERQKARVILNRSVRKGDIIKPSKCSKCNKKCKVEGHHPSYTQPLVVEWVCRQCHSMLK